MAFFSLSGKRNNYNLSVWLPSMIAKGADGPAVTSWTALSGIAGPTLTLVPKTKHLDLEIYGHHGLQE